MPTWEGKTWAGASEIGAIERRQDTPPSRLLCTEREFDGYVCMSYRSLGCLYDQFVNNCAAFKDPGRKCQPVDAKTVKAALRALRY
jgi:hypothetical protein